MRFSQREIKDLVFAWVLISAAFAILFTGVSGIFSFAFLISLGIAGLTAGIGFLLHELMHKYVAQNYGLHAEFKAFYGMLWLAVGMSLFGFILAAPGAVMISGMITRAKNGRISLAGPATNIALAMAFLIPLLFFDFSGFLGLFVEYGFRINSLLALFNMIPAMPFDGAKIKAWDNGIYWATVIVAAGLFIWSLFL